MRLPLSLRLLAARRITFVLILALFSGACTPQPIVRTPTPSSPISSTAIQLQLPTSIPPEDGFSDIPAQARVATRQGDPRPAGYWSLWNSCAPDNRASIAAANGGRAEGWILLDDLIANPGIQLGDYPVTTCQEGLSLLRRRTAAGEETGDPLYKLASHLLAAELNLGAGAETCPIAEEAVLGGHLILSEAGFDGPARVGAALKNEAKNAVPRLLDLLAAYNSGALCQ